MNEMFAPLTEADHAAGARIGPVTDKPVVVPRVPVPERATPMDFRHPERGKPSRVWPYHDAEGRLVGYVCRWDFTDANGKPDKLVLPVTFCDLGGGARGWRAKGIPAPRPLFGLPEILARPDAVVLVVEGEKAAEAAMALFPDLTVTTPMHGAKSPHLTDWTPLAGRTVLAWPDADDTGAAFAAKVADLALKAGAASAAVVTLPAGLPQKWDPADPLPDGMVADVLHEAIAAALAGPAVTIETRPSRREWPFRLTGRGVEKRTERVDKESGATTVEWKWICSPLAVVAETRSTEGEEWGRLLGITDRDGRAKLWAMPMAMLAGDGTSYRERLLSLGLELAPGSFARNALHDYISTARPGEKARAVTALGWSGRNFVLPRQTFGDQTGERILFQSDGGLEDPFRKAGTLAGWQDRIARPAIGNSRLVFALSAAFAGPLMLPADAEGGGFHFRGGSSIGKTTCLYAAGSVWGGHDFKRTWRATSNGLEGAAVIHSDTLLVLDEMSECAADHVGPTAYMLANGQGKTRAGRNGDARRPARWRVLFLSTGEVGLADKMNEDGRGRRAAAGQEVRVVDIPADAGAGLGIFEHLGDFQSAGDLAEHLRRATAETCGTAGPAYLDILTRDPEAIGQTVREIVREFVAETCPADADGQVRRVAARFGLVAAGGEVAVQFGILPWPEGEASKAAARCFNDWLAARGGIEPAEDREAVATVRRFIEAHGTSRFEAMWEVAGDQPESEREKVVNRVGFRRRARDGSTEYVILPEMWRTEICAGHDAGRVARVLADKGFLLPGSDGKPQRVTRIPGVQGSVRAYVITSGILAGA